MGEPNPVYPSSNYVTSYTYDIEGHLTQVYMQRPTSGAGMQTQTRTFNYDLPTGRLLNATNPENGTVSYTYMPDGAVASMTDAKGQRVLYSYDGYGRISYIDRYPTGSQLPDPCQTLALTYDSSSGSGMGRLYTVSWRPPWTPPNLYVSCGGTSFAEIYTYNQAGQVTYKGYGGNMQTSFSPNTPMFGSFGVGEYYAYDNEGTLTSYSDDYYNNNQLPTYTFTWTYSLDSMERPIELTEQDEPSGNAKTWVQGVAYGPLNEMRSMQFATSTGAFYTENRTYNNQLQLTNITAGGSGLPTGINLTYTYNAGHNNGQASGMSDGVSGESVAYAYDQLSRLIQAETTQSQSQYPNAPRWGQAYTYDGFGNLLTKAPAGPGNTTTMSLTVNSNTNQYTASSGYGYDANGNVTTLPQSGGPLTLGYDTENRFSLSADGVSGYDLENLPLEVTGSGLWPVYDLDGRRLRHETVTFGYNPQNPEFNAIDYTINDRNVYFGGRMIQSNSKTVLVDRTGSVRADETGATFEYLPYGEEFTLTAQDREKFATYTRSSASGLDFAQQRWYDSVHGSFVTPDWLGKGIDPSTPATFNRYAYVTGDPVNRYDPTGSYIICVTSGSWDGEGYTGGTGGGCYMTSPMASDPVFSAQYPTYLCNDGTLISTLESSVVANCQSPIATGTAQGPGAPPYQPPMSNNLLGPAENAARVDLSNLTCYSLFGFGSASAAQGWFDTIRFNYASYGLLSVQGRSPVPGTPPPAFTLGYGTININTDYNWADFSKVNTQQGGTFNYLAYWNRMLGARMTSDQFASLIVLHELEHNRPAGTNESIGAKRLIYLDCIH